RFGRCRNQTSQSKTHLTLKPSVFTGGFLFLDIKTPCAAMCTGRCGYDGADDGNRTRTVSLGSYPPGWVLPMAVMEVSRVQASGDDHGDALTQGDAAPPAH